MLFSTMVSTLCFLLLDDGTTGSVKYLLCSSLKICSLHTKLCFLEILLRQWHIDMSKKWTSLIYLYPILLVFFINLF